MCNQDARAPLGRCRLLLTSTPYRGSCAFAWLWQPSITKDVLPVSATLKHFLFRIRLGRIPIARLAQSAERKALNLVVVGSSPTVGVLCGSPRPGAMGNAETMIHSRVIRMGGDWDWTNPTNVLQHYFRMKMVGYIGTIDARPHPCLDLVSLSRSKSMRELQARNSTTAATLDKSTPERFEIPQMRCIMKCMT